MRVGFILTMAVNIVLFAIIELLPTPLMRMFGSDAEMIALGVTYLRICSLDFLFVPFQGSLTGYLIGSGHTTLPAGISLCSSFVFRLPAAYIIGILLGGGIAGVAAATPIASFSVGVFSLIYYLSGRCNKVQRIIEE
jgi:Na+-driven multidrug efflux pump